MKWIKQRGILVLLAVVLTACGTIDKMNKENGLDAVLKSYGHAVRWESISILPRFLQPELAKTQPAVAVDPENVRVISYEVVSPPVMLSETEAVQVVKIQYLFRDQQRVLSLTDNQQWQFDETTESWQRSNHIPVFK